MAVLIGKLEKKNYQKHNLRFWCRLQRMTKSPYFISNIEILNWVVWHKTKSSYQMFENRGGVVVTVTEERIICKKTRVERKPVINLLRNNVLYMRTSTLYQQGFWNYNTVPLYPSQKAWKGVVHQLYCWWNCDSEGDEILYYINRDKVWRPQE